MTTRCTVLSVPNYFNEGNLFYIHFHKFTEISLLNVHIRLHNHNIKNTPAHVRTSFHEDCTRWCDAKVILLKVTKNFLQESFD